MKNFSEMLGRKGLMKMATLGVAGLALSGCEMYGDYGTNYASGSYYDCDPYDSYDSYYGCDYRYGFSNIGFGGGWYDNYWYPGYGFYLFDSYGTRYSMRDNHRRYWGQQRYNWYRGHRGDHDGRGRGDGYSDNGGRDRAGRPEGNGGRDRNRDRDNRGGYSRDGNNGNGGGNWGRGDNNRDGDRDRARGGNGPRGEGNRDRNDRPRGWQGGNVNAVPTPPPSASPPGRGDRSDRPVARPGGNDNGDRGSGWNRGGGNGGGRGDGNRSGGGGNYAQPSQSAPSQPAPARATPPSPPPAPRIDHGGNGRNRISDGTQIE